MKYAAVALLVVSLSVPAGPAHAHLGPSEQCVSSVANTVADFANKRADCLRKCEDDVSRGRNPERTVCVGPSSDPSTQRCLERAAEKLTGRGSAVRRHCTGGQIARLYGGDFICGTRTESVDGYLQCLEGRFGAEVDVGVLEVYRPLRMIPTRQ